MKFNGWKDVLVLGLLLGMFIGLPAAWRHWRDQQAADVLVALAKPGDITMFSTTDCSVCASSKSWLNEHKVAYTECQTDVVDACAQRFAAIGGVGVPTMQVKGRVQTGFSPPWIAEVLAQANSSGSQTQSR